MPPAAHIIYRVSCWLPKESVAEEVRDKDNIGRRKKKKKRHPFIYCHRECGGAG